MADYLPVAFDLRAEIEALAYEDISSITDAALLRQKMAAAVEVAKRAGADEAEYRTLAREAERTLGRMLLAGREAGDVTGWGRSGGESKEAVSLLTLGINERLAQDSVVFAKVPDEVWKQALVDSPSRAALSRLIREYLASIEDAASRRAKRDAELAKQAKEISDELTRLQTDPPPPPLPPLTEEELSLSDAGGVLRAMFIDPINESRDQMAPLLTQDLRPEVVKVDLLLSAMGDLWRQIEATPPVLHNDNYRLAKILSARDAVARVTRSLTIWLRKLDELDKEDRND